MNIDKIVKGKEFKNYKMLCEELGLEFKKNTNSKKSQFKEIERYCRLSKSGQKIIIEEVYDTVHDKVDLRGQSIYRDVVQLLIADLLAQRKGHISISKSKLMRAIGIVNTNYNECKEEIPKLSKYSNVNKNVIFDFYNTSASSFKWIIESSLDDLMDKRVITYKKITKVSEKDVTKDYGFITREAYEEEVEEIMIIEKEELELLGYEKMSQVRMSKNWKSFQARTQNRVKLELGINFYYTAYDIIINNEYIVKERNKLATLLLEKVKRQESKEELNNLIYTNLIKNAENRRDKGYKNGKKTRMRTDKDYVTNIKQLSDLLISIDQLPIIQEVKEIKLNENIEKELELLFG